MIAHERQRNVQMSRANTNSTASSVPNWTTAIVAVVWLRLKRLVHPIIKAHRAGSEYEIAQLS